MDRERWARVEAIFLAALEHEEPAARAAFLDDACASDPSLRDDVERLIAGHEADPSFLNRALIDVASLGAVRANTGVAAAAPAESDPGVGFIGPYHLVKLIGRGGMGEVYLARRETEDFSQHVALKIVRPGMDSDDVIRRFRQERRILASLAHSNIAKLFDAAATPDGRPYFVMEYVDGVPVDAYCRDNDLTLQPRLELFQVICRAVQHAHQNLIVHRDIKPGNILVTQDGVPKLLDFGIGKVLAERETLAPSHDTRTAVRTLTPEYAAPEQVTGDVITTATDVHALGILLYMLLTGRHPYVGGNETLREVERAIVSTDPRPPSDVVTGETRRQLAGDIDMIVLKALRKEPERRYPTAAALADDIARYLEGLPVHARPDTIGYRTRKFVRRNAAWVSAGAIAVVALVTITTMALVQSRRLGLEVARTQSERDKALEVRAFLMEVFGAGDANRAGDTVTARQLLDLQAATLAEAYADQPELHVEMMEVLADGYDRLGLYGEAEKFARDALERRRATASPADPALATSLNLYGWIIHELGRSGEAESMLREAAGIHRQGGPRQRRALARALNDLGVVLDAQRRHAEAETVLREALDLRVAELGETHRSAGITASNLAASYYFQQKYDEAVAVQERAVRALQASVGRDHQRTILAQGNLATFRLAKGDFAAAADEYRSLLAQQTRLNRRNHPVSARMMASLGITLYTLGRNTGNAEPVREAATLFGEAVRILEPAIGPDHEEVRTLRARLGRARTVIDSLEAAARVPLR